jgi:hypothetical protein
MTAIKGRERTEGDDFFDGEGVREGLGGEGETEARIWGGEEEGGHAGSPGHTGALDPRWKMVWPQPVMRVRVRARAT